MTSLTYQAARLTARIDATKKLVKVAASGNREAYSYYREGSDLWEKPKQKYSSSETSINSKKLPSVFSKIVKEKDWRKGINIDIGGGKFDNVDQWMQENGYGRNLVFDPFNRSEQHNRSVVDTIKKNGGANSATISNVLNVIAEPENRKKVLQQAYDATKPDGVVYISIYEGSKDGKPKESTKGWQENRNTQSYLSEVKEVFSSASVKNGIIRASKN